VNDRIALQRLHNQYITRAKRGSAADLVAALGAVQAQEYPAARWGLSLRMSPATTEAEIARAFDEGRILRTHVLRPTWHFVTPDDIRWMLELTAPRVQRTIAHYARRSGLDQATLTRAARVFERSLGDGRFLTRAELGGRLGRAGIAASGVRLALVTEHAELEGVICSGPRRGNTFTYALLAERAPRARRMSRDESLAELARRYFSSHGPATVRDFVWWSGLTTLDARRGLELNRARHQVVDGLTYWTVGRASAADSTDGGVRLLPIYDEYLVAYRDRDAVPHRASTVQARSGRPVAFHHAIVIRGQVAGTWSTARRASELVLEAVLFRRLTAPERHALADATDRYGRFLNAPISLSIA
jgi:hypothetical protein